jgi:hypothetical protein
LGWFGIAIYQIGKGWNIINESTWQIENQILLNEFFSPDSTKKIGLYKYYSGALGYTAIQMSVTDPPESYPLTGNILMINRIPPVIEWKTLDSVFVLIDKSNSPGFTIDSSKKIEDIYFEFEVIATDSTYLKKYEH